MIGSEVRVAYCPTLGSPGGLAAAANLYALVTGSDIPPHIFIGPSLPKAWSSTVTLCVPSGHLGAVRMLNRLSRDHEVVKVTALQNPALLRSRWRATTVAQNHAAFHPVLAAGRARRLGEMLRYLVVCGATVAQLRASDRWYALNADIPTSLKRIAGYAGAVSNRALAVQYSGTGDLGGDRDIDVVWVGSMDGFRRPDLFLRACRWLPSSSRVVLVARSADGGVLRSVRRKVDGLRQKGLQVELEVDAPHDLTMSLLLSARVAAFTSEIEGSPVAFIEACRLTTSVVAADRLHYRASVPTDSSAEVTFVPPRVASFAEHLARAASRR